MTYNLFESDEKDDWLALHQAIEDADTVIACTNYPEAFFPEGDTGNAAEVKWAREMCRECPVMLECGQFALKWQPLGIWGGMTGSDRRQISKRLRLKAA